MLPRQVDVGAAEGHRNRELCRLYFCKVLTFSNVKTERRIAHIVVFRAEHPPSKTPAGNRHGADADTFRARLTSLSERDRKILSRYYEGVLTLRRLGKSCISAKTRWTFTSRGRWRNCGGIFPAGGSGKRRKENATRMGGVRRDCEQFCFL